jgi:catechol 2,3-dioxygenase-like lactoylglutathione lyase family enzyme
MLKGLMQVVSAHLSDAGQGLITVQRAISDQVVDHARCVPVLASLDVGVSRRFYVEHLGFDVVYEAPTYLIVRRDQMELHFWLASDKIHPESTSCYIRGAQIAALHAEFSARSVPRLSTFEVRPWNMKEFYIHDPHGNLLRFGTEPDDVTRRD